MNGTTTPTNTTVMSDTSLLRDHLVRRCSVVMSQSQLLKPVARQRDLPSDKPQSLHAADAPAPTDF